MSDPVTYPTLVAPKRHGNWRDPIPRFWKNVDRRGPDECWPWVGSLNSGGYGRFKVDGKTFAAHRFSWQLHNGPIPLGEGYHGTCVCHECDNPPCVNPNHLFIGTVIENVEDMNAKGRHADLKGSSHPIAELTEDDVREIRRRYALGGVTQTDLGREFGVTYANIHIIVRRKGWTHI